MLNLDKRSPTETTCSVLGLWTINAIIDKYKLLFLGRLCRSSTQYTYKQIFCFKLSQIVLGIHDSGITYDLVSVAVKYELQEYIVDYIKTSVLPPKWAWSNIISNNLHKREETTWVNKLLERTELTRFRSIHSSLNEHILIQLAGLYPEKKTQILHLLKLGCMAIKHATCSLCNVDTSDIVLHVLLNCPKTISERNEISYKIVDILPVSQSVEFFNQEDNDK